MGLAAVHDRITALGAVLGAAALACIVVTYGYEVVARYLFSSPTEWASEFVPYFLCASVFLIMPEITRTKAHIAVTIVVEAIPARLAGVMGACTLVLAFLACLAAGWISLEENFRQFTNGVQLLGAYVIPKWWISPLISYGFLNSALYFLREAAQPRAGSERAPVQETVQ